MAAPFTFKYVRASQLDQLDKDHGVLLLERNRRHNPLAFWRHLSQCPDLAPDFPAFFYILDNDTVVASVKTIPDTMFFGRQVYPWAWTGDLYTEPAYRGQGAASCLWGNMTLVFQHSDRFIAAAYANTVSAHIFRKIGYTFTDNANRLLLFKNCRAFLNAHSRHKRVNLAIDTLYRAALHCLKPILHRPHPHLASNHRLQRLDPADPSISRIFDHLTYPEPFHFNDTTKRLQWKFDLTSHCTLHAVIEAGSDNPELYFISKNRYIAQGFAGRYADFNLMTLMDFGTCSVSENNMDLLAHFLITTFWHSDAEVLEVVTSHPPLIRKLYPKGFIKAGRGADFFYKAPLRQNDLHPSSLRIENWHFTHFASDAYAFA